MRTTVRSRFLLATVAALVLAACQSDELGSPELELQRTYDGPTLRLPGFAGLDLSISGANTCDEAALERDNQGKFKRWQGSERKFADVRPAAKDTVLALYQIWHFDENGKQTAKAECILPRGEAANLFARDYFSGGSRNTGTRPLITLYSIGAGTDCYWINSQGDVNCGGVICFLGMIYMRAPISAAASMGADAAPVGTETVSTSSSLIATWDCADGGALSMEDNGSVIYHSPGGSGGGGGGGGGGGSGCTENPTPGDTNDDGSPVQDELRSGGYGFSCSDSIPVGPLTNCDPTEALCYIDLDSAEVSMFERGLDMARPFSEFTDTVAAAICDTLVTEARAALSAGWVHRGNPFVSNGPYGAHTGASIPDPQQSGAWKIHIEHLVIFRATDTLEVDPVGRTSIAATSLLHEMAHVRGHDHAGQTSTPYTAFPFNIINAADDSGILRCIP